MEADADGIFQGTEIVAHIWTNVKGDNKTENVQIDSYRQLAVVELLQ